MNRELSTHSSRRRWIRRGLRLALACALFVAACNAAVLIASSRRVTPVGHEGEAPKRRAAVVLGCTHYSFIRPFISTLLPEGTPILDGNAGTVRQLRRRLEETGMLNPGTQPGRVTLETSGSEDALTLMRRMFEEAKHL